MKPLLPGPFNGDKNKPTDFIDTEEPVGKLKTIRF